MTKTHVPAAHNQFSSGTEEITVQCFAFFRCCSVMHKWQAFHAGHGPETEE